jgi:hypothetical protein
MGRGIDVYFADETFRTPVYGYEGKVTVEYERFDERLEELRVYVPETTAQHQASIMDAKKAVEQFVADGSKDRENVVQVCAQKAVQTTAHAGALDGAIQENERYKSKADAMREAAEGAFVFSRQEFESAAASLSRQAKQEEVKYIALGTRLGIIQDNIRMSAKGSPRRQKFGNEFWRTFNEYLQAINRMNIYNGAANENQQYMMYLDKYIRAAGGEKSEAVLLETIQKGELINA